MSSEIKFQNSKNDKKDDAKCDNCKFRKATKKDFFMINCLMKKTCLCDECYKILTGTMYNENRRQMKIENDKLSEEGDEMERIEKKMDDSIKQAKLLENEKLSKEVEEMEKMGKEMVDSIEQANLLENEILSKEVEEMERMRMEKKMDDSIE